MLDKTTVYFNTLAQLLQFDPLVDRMSLGYITWADNNHLFHLSTKSYAVGTIGHCLRLALTGDLERGAHQG